MQITERMDFLCQWLSNPRRVAAVTPSSKALADLMTREIEASDAPVIELGPGTGVFTRALLDRGIPEERLLLIEYGWDFAETLKRRFPKAQVLQLDAAMMANVDLLGGQKAAAVVSGLPLLSMRPKRVMMIMKGAFAHLSQRGAFYQFTYSYQSPIPRPITERLGLKAVHIGRTLANVPPAAVYRISRRGPARPLL